VDLHKRHAQIAVVDDAGTVRSNCAVACDRDSVRQFFGSLPEPVEVVMEATSP
jgi:transposase